jgi:hypothetical protein
MTPLLLYKLIFHQRFLFKYLDVTENVLCLARFSLAYEICKLGLMPSSAFFDNDGHQLAPDPSDWQLFAYPHQGTGPPRIRIPIQKLSNCGKGNFLGDDPGSDTESGDCPLSPSEKISFIKDSHSVVPPPVFLFSQSVQTSVHRMLGRQRKINALQPI